jgi:hypothetical protein
LCWGNFAAKETFALDDEKQGSGCLASTPTWTGIVYAPFADVPEADGIRSLLDRSLWQDDLRRRLSQGIQRESPENRTLVC